MPHSVSAILLLVVISSTTELESVIAYLGISDATRVTSDLVSFHGPDELIEHICDSLAKRPLLKRSDVSLDNL